MKGLQTVSRPSLTVPHSPQPTPHRPTMLEKLHLWPLPRYHGWLGWCDDGFPMGFSLKWEETGPYLYLVEDDAAGFRFLNTLAGSLSWYNEPRHVQFVFITDRPHTAWWFRHHRNPEHQDQTPEGRNLLLGTGQPVDHVYAYHTPGVGLDSEIICHLAGVLQARTYGRFLDGGWVLFLENLPHVWENLEDDARAVLPYILEKGPLWMMQTVTWMRWEDLRGHRVSQEILSRFHIRIFGAARHWTPPVPNAGLLHILQPDEAIVRADGRYMKFWAPAP